MPYDSLLLSRESRNICDVGLGLKLGLGLGLLTPADGGGSPVPSNAVTLDDGTPVVDDAGNYVTLG